MLRGLGWRYCRVSGDEQDQSRQGRLRSVGVIFLARIPVPTGRISNLVVTAGRLIATNQDTTG